MRRHAAAALVAFVAATTAIGLRASPVAAECPYLPPWPPITQAIPSAREIIVGEIVTDFTLAELDLASDRHRDYALRVTHVLRGDHRRGDMLDVQALLPNWPQVGLPEGMLASCTFLSATPGDVIALAFDALQQGGPMKDGERAWIQPPTRYNALGVITGAATDPLYETRRERVTLARLQHLASLPPTDTAGPRAVNTGNPILPVAAGLLGLLATWRRSSAARGVGQRVAPDGAVGE